MKKNQLSLLFVFLLSLCGMVALALPAAQEIKQANTTITGTVTDNAGNQLVAVAVSVAKHKNRTALTDAQGKYSIQAKVGETLVFSALGYTDKKIKIRNGKTVINVVLLEQLMLLEDELVTISDMSTSRMMVKDEKRYIQAEIAPAPPPLKSVIILDHTRNVNQEEYSSFEENGFRSPLQDPLSTFSIDVDAASYSNVRRIINAGHQPPADAVRIEEMINYFEYSYPTPRGKDPVSIATEVATCPWNKAHRLVKIGLKAKEMDVDQLPASNLVFLIDVSGSMNRENRIELVKSSMKLLVNNLRQQDKVSIVVYANGVYEKLAPTSGSEKDKIMNVINALTASGGTNGGQAIQMAYNLARNNFVKNGNNRIILCTDGDFNIGISNDNELVQMIEKERESGVFLSILGYGMNNYKDKKMQALAQAGNGNHAYIDNMQEANKVLVNEFGATMHAVAKDVKLQLEFNPRYVQAYRLVGYETRLLNDKDFNDDTKDAGEMGIGHTVTALYEVVPVGAESNVFNVDDLKYQQNKKVEIRENFSPDLLTIKLRYKNIDSNKSNKMEVAVIDKGYNNASDDFKFAAAVAMFGQLLRNSTHKGDATYQDVIKLSQEGKGIDKNGYRSEFTRLVQVSVNR